MLEEFDDQRPRIFRGDDDITRIGADPTDQPCYCHPVGNSSHLWNLARLNNVNTNAVDPPDAGPPIGRSTNDIDSSASAREQFCLLLERHPCPAEDIDDGR